MLSTDQMGLTELLDIFSELEVLLDGSDIDEGWSDWLTECAYNATHITDRRERTHLLLQIQDSVRPLSQLHVYLPTSTRDGTDPSQKLDELISALDHILQLELGDLETKQ